MSLEAAVEAEAEVEDAWHCLRHKLVVVLPPASETSCSEASSPPEAGLPPPLLTDSFCQLCLDQFPPRFSQVQGASVREEGEPVRT